LPNSAGVHLLSRNDSVVPALKGLVKMWKTPGTASYPRAPFTTPCPSSESGQRRGHMPRRSRSILALGTTPTKAAVTLASRMTKTAGIFLIPKSRTNSRSWTGTNPTIARFFVSAATWLRTDAIRLHGRQVSL